MHKILVFESVLGDKNMWNQLKYLPRMNDQHQYFLKQHWNGSPNSSIDEIYLIYPIEKEMSYVHKVVIVQNLNKCHKHCWEKFFFSFSYKYFYFLFF